MRMLKVNGATIELLATVVGFTLVLVGMSTMGESKNFQFVTGEVTMVIAIVTALTTARNWGLSKVELFGIFVPTLWFVLGSVSFMRACDLLVVR